MEILIYILAGFVGIIAFFLTWSISNFFIPPRDFWSKSGFTIFTTKFGMAFGAAFYTVSLILIYFSKS